MSNYHVHNCAIYGKPDMRGTPYQKAPPGLCGCADPNSKGLCKACEERREQKAKQ
jgi:hypothetical protein